MQKSIPHQLKNQALYIDGKDRTDEVSSYSLDGGKYFVTYKNNGKSYSYPTGRIEIVQSAIQSQKAGDLFSYLKDIAESIGLKTEEGNNILARSYERIRFIPETSILYHYLNGKEPKQKKHYSPADVFPFGFNLSQKKGVDEAFNYPLSVIEGPPGTGKTQTILNIIANAVMNNQSVAVVSRNNSATKNVFEKYITTILNLIYFFRFILNCQKCVVDLHCSFYQFRGKEFRSPIYPDVYRTLRFNISDLTFF